MCVRVCYLLLLFCLTRQDGNVFPAWVKLKTCRDTDLNLFVDSEQSKQSLEGIEDQKYRNQNEFNYKTYRRLFVTLYYTTFKQCFIPFLSVFHYNITLLVFIKGLYSSFLLKTQFK